LPETPTDRPTPVPARATREWPVTLAGVALAHALLLGLPLPAPTLPDLSAPPVMATLVSAVAPVAVPSPQPPPTAAARHEAEPVRPAVAAAASAPSPGLAAPPAAEALSGPAPSAEPATADVPATSTASPAGAGVAAAPGPDTTAPLALDNLNVVCPQQAAPVYPALSRRLRESGQVTLRIALDDSGRITGSEVLHSSGSRRLDNAAREAVSRYRCRPAERNGRPTAAFALQRIDFILQ
jgi:protein TonB